MINLTGEAAVRITSKAFGLVAVSRLMLLMATILSPEMTKEIFIGLCVVLHDMRKVKCIALHRKMLY